VVRIPGASCINHYAIAVSQLVVDELPYVYRICFHVLNKNSLCNRFLEACCIIRDCIGMIQVVVDK
jgi:hypothetical protein